MSSWKKKKIPIFLPNKKEKNPSQEINNTKKYYFFPEDFFFKHLKKFWYERQKTKIFAKWAIKKKKKRKSPAKTVFHLVSHIN